MQQNKLNFNLPWNSHDNYTICVTLPSLENIGLLKTELGGDILEGYILVLESGKKWADNYHKIQRIIKKYDLEDIRISILSEKISAESVASHARGIAELNEIAENLWLGDALLENRVECHFQAIKDVKNNVIGYESFARVKNSDGSLVSGNKIIEASFFLGIQHGIDKYLHQLAIQTFAKNNLAGNLFINFMTGFIQIPAKYLESFSISLKDGGLEPSRLVLDVSKSDHVTNIDQIASVVDFCHSKGYQVALDDIKQLEALEAILAKTMPDYVKIDRALVQHITRPIVLEKVKEIIALSHSRGCQILAEGVEDEKSYLILADLGVDMFQGYYFAKPLPASEIKNNSKKVTKEAV